MQNFNFHSHTYRCGHADDTYTDEEYVLDYIKNGFKKISFTDHAPEKNKIDKREDMRMDYNIRNEYYNSVKKLKDKYADKIEIQTGYEIEYLPDDVENILELKKETDKLILGQHFVYDDDEKNLKVVHAGSSFEDRFLIKYGEYVEKAMELKIPNIIAHPDFVMLGREKFGELEEQVTRKICKASEKYGIPLEINLNGIFSKTYYKDRKLNKDSFDEQVKRLKNVIYPCKDFWKIVSEYNVKVVYGLDTHQRGHIDRYKELITLATMVIGEDTIKKLNFVEDV